MPSEEEMVFRMPRLWPRLPGESESAIRDE